MYCYGQCPRPCSRPPSTHTSAGDSWTLTGKSGSVSHGVTAPFSWVLVHASFCLCPSRVYFPSCVSSGSSIVGLMATSSRRAYATPRSAGPRVPAPAADLCWPIPPQGTLKHSSGSVSVGPCVLVCTRFVRALWASLVGMGSDSKCEFAPPTILLGLLLWPWTSGISSQPLQHCTATTPAPTVFPGHHWLGRGVSPQDHVSATQPLLLI